MLLLDEPTAGPHQARAHADRQILVDLSSARASASLIVEHDLDFVREISTRIIVLHQGNVLLDGSVAEVVGLRAGADDLCGRRRIRSWRHEPERLDIADVSSGYGEAMVVRNVSLEHPARRNLCPARQERHGQEHAAQDGTGLPPGPEGQRSSCSARTSRRAHPFDRAQGHRLHSPGADAVPGPDSRGQSPARPPRRIGRLPKDWPASANTSPSSGSV